MQRTGTGCAGTTAFHASILPLAAINPISTSDYPAKDGRVGELHFLRGALYFWLKIHFDRVPYVDETTAPTAVVSNTAQTSQQLWDTIIADFRAAVASLPATQSQVGRANKYAAEAYLAKTLLYAAYVQDPTTHAGNVDRPGQARRSDQPRH